MFAGTRITFVSYYPNFGSEVSAVKETIATDYAVEQWREIGADPGSPGFLGSASFDITQAIFTFTINTTMTFTQPSGVDAFNGLAFTFDLLEESPSISIKDVRILAGYNTLEYDDSIFRVAESTIGVNVGGLSASSGEYFRAVIDISYSGSGRRDIFSGGEGNDKVSGRGGADILLGGAGNDRIKGGAGNDVIDGEAGRDRISGNGGADVFVLSVGGGRDIITDFDDLDQIRIQTGAREYRELKISEKGDNLLISDGREKFILLDTSLSEINETDFIF